MWCPAGAFPANRPLDIGGHSHGLSWPLRRTTAQLSRHVVASPIRPGGSWHSVESAAVAVVEWLWGRVAMRGLVEGGRDAPMVRGIDARPFRTSHDERATLVGHLRFQRESLLRKLDGISEKQARWSPVGSGTSLLWLLRHVGYAESIWVLDRFARVPTDPDLLGNALRDDDTIDSLATRYRSVWQIVDETIAASDLDAVCHVDDDMSDPDLRWVLTHLANETARHAGHADILRELIDGTTGR